MNIKNTLTNYVLKPIVCIGLSAVIAFSGCNKDEKDYWNNPFEPSERKGDIGKKVTYMIDDLLKRDKKDIKICPLPCKCNKNNIKPKIRYMIENPLKGRKVEICPLPCNR